ncbi:aldo/keto reductase [Lachnospiraceae bacterium OttesenSCG-928-E19]|nr:aldo/keto reductase [Lachnospiraceae bacterium OttesenSCG-928-E19]
MFKKLLSILILSVAVLGGCDMETPKIGDPKTASKKLSNGVEIPILGFGTWKLVGIEGYVAIRSAIENGYSHIDTAFVYDNETEVGMAIDDSGIAREDLFITSKVPHYVKSYAGTIEHFEKSLADLKTDYIDLYLIHWPVTQPMQEVGDNYYMENREVWRALEDLYKSGLVRAIGVSNFSIADLKNIIAVANVKPMVNQIKYHIGHTPNDIVKFCKKHDIIIEGYSTLGRGAVLNSMDVQKMATKYGVTPAQIAIRYSLQRGIVPLVKASAQAHQLENQDVNFEISHDDMKKLDELEISSTNW